MGCSELSLPSTNSQNYWPESSVVKALMCRLWSSTSVQVLPWHFLIIWSSQIIGTKINVYNTFSRMNKIWYTKAWFPNQWPSEPWLNNVWQAFSYISEWMKDSVSSRSSDWRAVSLSPEKKGGGGWRYSRWEKHMEVWRHVIQKWRYGWRRWMHHGVSNVHCECMVLTIASPYSPMHAGRWTTLAVWITPQTWWSWECKCSLTIPPDFLVSDHCTMASPQSSFFFYTSQQSLEGNVID